MESPCKAGDTTSLLKKATDAARKNRYEEAFSIVHRLLSGDPSCLKALDLAGYIRFFQKDYAAAETYCRRALDIDPGHTYAKSGLGMCLARQGKLNEGVALLCSAIDEKPQWSDPYWDLAKVLRDADRHLEALAILELAINRKPEPKKPFGSLVSKLKKQMKSTQEGAEE